MALTLLAGCAGQSGDDPSAKTVVPATAKATRAALDRAAAVQAAVRRWARATTLPAAQAAAEDARNLVTGPHAPGAGDADEDGRLRRVAVGLLPGEDGSPGLAASPATGCVQRNVLGGSWADPKARWSALTRRIDAWRPDHNTFPALPSHAQRVVGWATLTLRTPSLADAVQYAGHATGHARVVRRSLEDPAADPCPG